MLRFLPLTSDEAAVLRFTQLRLAARAYDANRVLDIAKRAYRDTRYAVSVVQRQMVHGDQRDAEIVATVEENNDRLEHSHAARVRRACIGIDIVDVLDDDELMRTLSAARWSERVQDGLANEGPYGRIE